MEERLLQATEEALNKVPSYIIDIRDVDNFGEYLLITVDGKKYKLQITEAE